MTEMQGFFYPRTATGRASLIPSPPWSYSGDLLTVEYRTDPARVAELLPAPLELADEDPGAVALIWADWQSCSTSREELLDPVRSQYKECFVVVRCQFEGRTYSRCVYIWVDKDFAMLRGMHQGYPKKLGSMWQTRPHPFPHAAPQIAAGGMFGATLAAGDRRLAEAVLTLREESETNGFVNGHPMAHHRVYPDIAREATGDAYAELIESGGAEFAGGQSWSGDVDLRLFDSPDRGAGPARGAGGHRRLLPPGRRGVERGPDPCAALSRVRLMPDQHTLEETERATQERVGALALDFPAAHAVSSLYRAANAARGHLTNTVLRPHDLTWTGFLVLWLLWIWGAMETRHVAESVGISKATLTGVTKTLVSRGLVDRMPSTSTGGWWSSGSARRASNSWSSSIPSSTAPRPSWSPGWGPSRCPA